MAQARGAALVPLQGGGGCRVSPVVAPPTLRAHPRGGGLCWGGGAPLSSSLRCTHVAGTTQARRKHGVRHLAAAGGGVSPLGLHALLHGTSSAPEDLQPLLPLFSFLEVNDLELVFLETYPSFPSNNPKMYPKGDHTR